MTGPNRPRRTVRARAVAVGALLALGVLGLGAASAASLGISVSGTDVAAGSAAVARCDNTVTTRLTDLQYDTTTKKFAAHSVTVDDVADACAGRTVTVAVRDASGALLASGTGTVGAAGATRTTVAIAALDPARAARIDAVLA